MLHIARALIVEKYRTQFLFALEVRIDPARLSRILRGYVKPTREERERIAAALGADVATVFAEGLPGRRADARPGTLGIHLGPTVQAR
jgi:transcriptional regulator with XRE-family HTH domain